MVVDDLLYVAIPLLKVRHLKKIFFHLGINYTTYLHFVSNLNEKLN